MGAAEELGRVHFIGIGGIGMSGIARIMLARGITVSGSDAKDSTALEALRVLGATIHIGHRADNVANSDTVVISTAIRPDNPELVEAGRLELRVIRRAAALAAVMAGRRGVAVTGTSGKTTTTSMLTVAVQHCGVDPSFAIGGDLGESGSNAHHGTGELFIAEADESDGSFLLLSPDAAIVTNVEVDHLDQHGTPEAYAKAFDDFLDRIRPPGILVCCSDDPGSAKLAEFAKTTIPSGSAPQAPLRTKLATVRTYGESANSDLRLTNIDVTSTGTQYEAIIDGGAPTRVAIGVTGRHLALNSAAALLMGLELGLPADKLIEGLAGYGGVRRRFELKGAAAGVRVYDDYAHHPTKVAAQLKAARIVAGSGRLIVAFQPHLYSRTKAFAVEFGAALSLADEVVVMEVAGVREDPVPGVTGALVADAITLPAQQVHYEPSWSAVPPLLARLARPGDLVVTMGAGDVTLIGPEVLRCLGALTG